MANAQPNVTVTYQAEVYIGDIPSYTQTAPAKSASTDAAQPLTCDLCGELLFHDHTHRCKVERPAYIGW